MAFRPATNLIEGVLDNTSPGRVVGWIDFYRAGNQLLHCEFDLNGDFHDDVRGRILHVWNDYPTDASVDGSLGRAEPNYMDRMHRLQVGKAGEITARRGEAYIEWYSERNGRIVLEIPPDQYEILGADVDLSKLPPRKSHPDAFEKYMRELAVAFRKHTKDPRATILAVGVKGVRPPDESERN